MKSNKLNRVLLIAGIINAKNQVDWLFSLLVKLLVYIILVLTLTKYSLCYNRNYFLNVKNKRPVDIAGNSELNIPSNILVLSPGKTHNSYKMQVVYYKSLDHLKESYGISNPTFMIPLDKAKQLRQQYEDLTGNTFEVTPISNSKQWVKLVYGSTASRCSSITCWYLVEGDKVTPKYVSYFANYLYYKYLIEWLIICGLTGWLVSVVYKKHKVTIDSRCVVLYHRVLEQLRSPHL
jgi:hypothetical protein